MMNVSVEGVVTSIEQKTKDDKKFTELLLAQKGEKQLIPVRLPGHVENDFSLYQIENFTGSLLTWKTRDGVGFMVSVRDD